MLPSSSVGLWETSAHQQATLCCNSVKLIREAISSRSPSNYRLVTANCFWYLFEANAANSWNNIPSWLCCSRLKLIRGIYYEQYFIPGSAAV